MVIKKIWEQFMKNIFQTGRQVKGDSFIGRAKLVEDLKKRYLTSDGKAAISIVGLPRIGKTSLALNVFDEIPSSIIYVYVDLAERSCYNEIWQEISIEIEEYLNKHNINYDCIKECFEKIKSGNIQWIILTRSVKKFFQELNELKLKVIIVLDEFDKARDLFENTQHFELFRTIFSDAKYNVSAMLLSRRKLYTIEGKTYQSSTFHGVFDDISLCGFDDSGMAEYYDKIFQEGIKLEKKQMEDIEYYAGRSPYLLSIIGHYIIESAEKGEPIDIKNIYKNKCTKIHEYYRDCINILKIDRNLERLVPFVIGPKIGVSQEDKAELEQLGLLSSKEDKYLSISEHFDTYLYSEMLKLPIFETIINLEKKTKHLIHKDMLNIIEEEKICGENINELQKSLLSKFIKEKDIDTYTSFINANQSKYNKDTSYFDVMSLKIAFRIIEKLWSNIFATYFNNDPLNKWQEKFKKCYEARNPVAHGHEEYLSDADKAEVDAYCKELQEILSKALQGVDYPSDEEILNCAKKHSKKCSDLQRPKYPAVKQSSDILEDSLIGKECDFLVEKINGKNKDNLRGIIDGKHKGTIPKNKLLGRKLTEMINKTFRVVITSKNGDNYIVEIKN